MKRVLAIVFVLTLSAFVAERANAQTASAKGSGTVAGASSCTSPTCVPPIASSGGKGVDFKFSFTGTGVIFGTFVVPANGTFTAVDRDTGISLAYFGTALIGTADHVLNGGGPCLLTANGTTQLGTCNFSAADLVSGGSDFVSFNGVSANISVAGTGTPASGNINID